MAKQNGLGWTTLSVADASAVARDIRNDITNLQFATPRGVQDVTGIDKSAYERILLLADFSITLNIVADFATNLVHDVFKTVPSTSVARATVIGVGGKSLTNNVLYTDYPLQRSNSGELTAAVPGVLADGAVPTWS
ncbi:hypothetical protein [Streptomyces sp. NPDC002573]|uniref:hypothetical protein n=1 Tax=Streptomyces sp. NPDC002573 TaxID=3364651 RepID=UPI0036CC204B